MDLVVVASQAALRISTKLTNETYISLRHANWRTTLVMSSDVSEAPGLMVLL